MSKNSGKSGRTRTGEEVWFENQKFWRTSFVDGPLPLKKEGVKSQQKQGVLLVMTNHFCLHYVKMKVVLLMGE